MKITFYSLFALFLFFLPFTQALTINIGFELKVSEVLMLFLIFLMLGIKNVSLKKTKTWDVFLIIFSVWVILSFLLNIYWNYDYEPKDVPYRINRVADSFLRVVYFFICMFTYFISCRILLVKIWLLDYWVKGAIVAAIYGWYLFFSSYFDIPYLRLPGILEHPQTIFGLIRSGTFKEGNFFGMFLLLSGAICFYQEKRKVGWFLLGSIISTLSTVSFISAILFIVVFYFNKIYTPRGVKAALVISLLFLVTTPFLVSTKFFQVSIQRKLMDPSNKITANNGSSIDRALTARIGYNIGKNNPFFGIGPYNYGNHYDEYNDIDEKLIIVSEYYVDFFLRKDRRAIANNVYMEVWAEYGIIGFIFYISFLLKIIFLAYKIKERAIFAGCICLLFSMNAFPSFIMLFIWVFLAIPVTINNLKLIDVQE